MVQNYQAQTFLGDNPRLGLLSLHTEVLEGTDALYQTIKD